MGQLKEMKKMRKNRKSYRDGFGAVVTGYPPRTKFNKSHIHKTALNVGELVPILWDELVPGDMINISVTALLRQMTMLKPVMDSLYVDIGVFWVPTLTIFPDFPKSLGASDDEWASKDKPLFPTISAPEGGWKVGTIADKLGIDVNKKVDKISRLPFMAYAKIFNDWYRNQNLEKAAHIDYTNTPKIGSNGDNPVIDAELGGALLKSNKTPDMFTTALPAPQKGDPVVLNVGGEAKVHAKRETFDTSRDESLHFDSKLRDPRGLGMDANGKVIPVKSQPIDLQDVRISPNNLYADLAEATGISINDLRMALSVQHLRELDSLSGTRYPEIIEARYGVKSDDRNLQRSELLGGLHLPLNVQQVAQLNSGEKGALGDLSAFSQTNAQTKYITKAVDEFGFLMVLATVRYKHTYSGMSKLWTHISDLDLYNPLFAHIGEQPIKNKEIYLSGDPKVDNETFGFQEAWYQYKFMPNRVSDIMRPNIDGSYGLPWHYADNYKQTPKLGSDWIKENAENVDRTLAVSALDPKNKDKVKQLIVEFGFHYKADRPMPAYSVPGLKRI